MNVKHTSSSPSAEGWRERKRRQTRQRIAEVGLRMFLDRGFEATTLAAITEAAGIARRTFFNYFDSKEALLFAYEDKAEQGFRKALNRLPDNTPPFEAMCTALLAMVSEFGTEEARALDTLLHSTETLRARKQSNYEKDEQLLQTALIEKWPDTAQHFRFRLIAMIGMGAMRVASDAWSTENGTRPLQEYLEAAFAELRDNFLF